MNQESRWKLRFANYQRALRLMQEIAELDLKKLSMLEKEGVVQRFEFTLELAWKTLKDKMEYDGLILDSISPKRVLKEAFKNKYIDDIEMWLKMINDRNALSHVYDFEVFEEVLPDIQQKYIPLFTALSSTLSEAQV
ncbi:MAG: nucleotidyltransferase substrate binding protein [Saprospiraceae bacterium]|nr:nucleotidyltransferase substrate binding protein [Saprospiraceae bacterium]